MPGIRWLHLSDLHFRKGEHFDESVVLDALLRDLDSRLGREFSGTNMIFVTGDVAYSGQPEEYELAAGFFDKLLSALSLPKERLFIVPGNHDVDRSLIKAGGYWVQAVNASDSPGECRKRAGEILTDDDARQLVMRRFRGYEGFINSYFPPDHLHFTDSAYSYTKAVNVNGIEVAVAGLNSAWLSGPRGDRGQLVLSDMQVRQALPQLVGKAVKIVLLHHPLEWLADWDRNYVELHLMQNAHFILHGHRHWQAFRQDVRPGATPFVFASGAGYEGRDLRNACNLVKLDLPSGAGSAVSLRYTDDNGGFWFREALDYPHEGKEVYSFDFQARHTKAPTDLKEEGLELADLISRPLDYLESAKQRGMLASVLPEHLVEVARQAPTETVDFLRWMNTEDSASFRKLIADADGGLMASLGWDPRALASYQELRATIAPPAETAQVHAGNASIYFRGPILGSLIDRLSLQIPTKDPSRPQLAEQVRFSLYLANLSTDTLHRPHVTVQLASNFLGYPYQGEPLRIEPSEYWRIARPDAGTAVCEYAAPPEYSSVVEPGKGAGLGTVSLLVPWGEADGRPIDLPIVFRIEAERIAPIDGQLNARILPALDFEGATRDGLTFDIPAELDGGIDAGLEVRRGQTLRFAARGIISFDAQNHFVDADGFARKSNGQRIVVSGSVLAGYTATGDLIMPGQRVGALVGWIGEWQERAAFLVGSSSTITAESDGRLHLCVNDVRGTFGDNSGCFQVGVKAE